MAGVVRRTVGGLELVDVTKSYMPAVIKSWWWVWVGIHRDKAFRRQGIRDRCVIKDSGLTAWYALVVAEEADNGPS